MTEANATIAKAKQTVPRLYVTAKEAYEKWRADPEQVKIVDVRTPEEYLFVGHPAMAWKIPAAAQSFEWDAVKGQFPMKLLPDFVSRVSAVAKLDDTLLVMSGLRSRRALRSSWRKAPRQAAMEATGKLKAIEDLVRYPDWTLQVTNVPAVITCTDVMAEEHPELVVTFLKGMKFVKPLKSLALGTLMCVAAGVLAQQVVYPAKGQTPDQQKKDESECYT